MAGSTYLTRSISSTGNRRKWTWSGWLKRSALSTNYIMSSNNGSSQYSMLQFDSTDVLRWYDYTSDFQSHLKTTRKFRDTNAWYHIVFAYDSAQSTAANRIKVYVNGVQETSFGTSSYPSQDYDSYMNYSGVPHYLGRETGTEYMYDGIMSHVHFTDGYAYAASDFGSTDATTGEWKINTSPSVSYGTNGYFMFKDDNSVNDDSGNGNNFTLTAGTLTKTEDNPSNVFATLNPLYPHTSTSAFTNGNTVASGYASEQGIVGTLGASSGKYYFEVKINSSSGERGMVGWGARDTGQITYPGGGAYDYGRYNQTTSYYNNNSETQISGSSAYTSGDICGCAIDLDNNKIYWYKNGVLENSGGTTITASSTAGNYFPIVRNGDGNNIQCNFGNGYFGTTAVSSAGTNASNIGIFEYDVPTGFTALCTKGLNE